MSHHPRLVCIPSRDRRFAADAERIAEGLPDGLPRDEAIGWFAAALSLAHPDAVVHEQDELGCSPGVRPAWYVVRQARQSRIDAAITVPLAPEAAFDAYVTRVTEWQDAVELRPRRLLPSIVGSEYEATYAFLGRRYQGTLRIVSVDRPRSVALEAAGSGIRVWYVTTFAAAAEGTRVTVHGDYELPRALLTRIADRLGLERAIARDIERANASFRRLCAEVASGLDLAAPAPG